jgi:hypothetical protein
MSRSEGMSATVDQQLYLRHRRSSSCQQLLGRSNMPWETSNRPVTCDPAGSVVVGRSSQPCARAELLGAYLYFIEENYVQGDFEHMPRVRRHDRVRA